MILEDINGPHDLKGLNYTQLKRLADEIRGELVKTVTANGGHLASNLGVVELTIALHRVFDSPTDKIIWDVGHQAYVHKLLTGRRQTFSTIRRWGGLSGFPERSESPHDVFGTGHASTSISAALGMAKARDLAGEKNHVIAVIGDGAMTGGMAFEALNQAGHLGTRLLVVLNDNNMSISPSVGALARVFNRLRLHPRYYRTSEGAAQLIRRFPLGKLFWLAVERFKNSVKGFFMPSMIWEELGFAYLGPIDGHNIPQLEAALTQAKEYPQKPALIHVLTKKGKGYYPAEDDAVSFHGVSPNGSKKNEVPTYTQVFGRTLLRIAQENPKVVGITAAMLDSTGLGPMAKEFPERVFDVGICEQHAVTFAAGLATQGYVPVVAIYSTFLQRAYDQILHDVCIQKLPVVLALDRSGLVGDDGKTHHGIYDLSYLRTIPGLTIAVPKDENELQHLLFSAISYGFPTAIRYPRGSGLGVPLESELHILHPGTGEVLREGKDLAILALGSMVYPALEAATRLKKEGIEASVVNARFVRPLDEHLIEELAKRTSRLVAVEENALSGGFGSAVLEITTRLHIPSLQVLRIALPDDFLPHGSPAQLRAYYGLNSDGIAQRIAQTFPELQTRHPSLTRIGV